jgi:hypothetical protein
VDVYLKCRAPLPAWVQKGGVGAALFDSSVDLFPGATYGHVITPASTTSATNVNVFLGTLRMVHTSDTRCESGEGAGGDLGTTLYLGVMRGTGERGDQLMATTIAVIKDAELNKEDVSTFYTVEMQQGHGEADHLRALLGVSARLEHITAEELASHYNDNQTHLPDVPCQHLLIPRF